MDGLCFQILPISVCKAMSNATAQSNIGNNSKILMFYSKTVSVSQEGSSCESFTKFPSQSWALQKAVVFTQEVNNSFVIRREQSNGIFEEEHEGSINYTICKFIAINLGRSEKKLIELDWSLSGKLLVKLQCAISRHAFQSSHWLLAESSTITNQQFLSSQN